MNIKQVKPFQTKELSHESPVKIYHCIRSRKEPPLYDMHYGLELGIILHGKIRRFYSNHQTDLIRGDVWFCGMWEPHGCEFLSAKSEVLVMTVWPTMLSTMRFEEYPEINFLAPFLVSPEHRPGTDNKNRKDILNIAERIIEIHSSGQSRYNRLWIRLLATELILTLQNDWNYRRTKTNEKSESFSKITPAVELVNDSQEYISARQAAAVCRMGLNNFCKLFKTMMGISFPDFALRYRLSRAADELLQTNKPIKMIAYQWGFTDTSHFHHRFRTYYNCSPRAYRDFLFNVKR